MITFTFDKQAQVLSTQQVRRRVLRVVGHGAERGAARPRGLCSAGRTRLGHRWLFFLAELFGRMGFVSFGINLGRDLDYLLQIKPHRSPVGTWFMAPTPPAYPSVSIAPARVHPHGPAALAIRASAPAAPCPGPTCSVLPPVESYFPQGSGSGVAAKPSSAPWLELIIPIPMLPRPCTCVFKKCPF